MARAARMRRAAAMPSRPAERAPDAREAAPGADLLAQIEVALEELEAWAFAALGALAEGEALSGAYATVAATTAARDAIRRGDARLAAAPAFQGALAAFRALVERDALRRREVSGWRSQGGNVRAAQVEAERRPTWELWLEMAADLERRIAGQGRLGTRATARWIAMELRRERGEIIPVATIRGVLRRKGANRPDGCAPSEPGRARSSGPRAVNSRYTLGRWRPGGGRT